MSWTVLGAFGGLVTGVADESATFNVGSGDQCVVTVTSHVLVTTTQLQTSLTLLRCPAVTVVLLNASNYDETAIDNGTCSSISQTHVRGS